MIRVNKRKIIIFNAIILLLILMLTVFVILYFNITLLKTFNDKKYEIKEKIQEIIGYNIEYSSVSPTILGNIKIKNLKLLNSETDNKLEIGDIVLSYSLLSVFKSKNISPVNFISGITLRKLNLNFNKEQFDETSKKLEKIFSNSEKKDSQIENLVINIVNSNFSFELTEKKNINLYSNSIKLKIQKDKIDIKSSIILKFVEEGISKYSTNSFINGYVDTGNNDVKSNLSFFFRKNFIDGLEITDQNFIFNSQGSDFNFRRKKDPIPITLEIYKTGDIVRGFFNLTNFKLDSLFLNKVQFLLPDNINSSLNFSYGISENKLSSHFKGNVYFSKLFPLGQSNFNFDLSATENNLFINSISYNSLINEGKGLITGYYNFKNRKSDLNINLDEVKIFSASISTDAVLNYYNRKTDIKALNVYSNGSDIGGFHYTYAYNKLNTIIPFNNLNIEIDKNNYNIEAAGFYLNPFLPSELNIIKKNIYLSADLSLYRNKNIFQSRKADFIVESDDRKISLKSYFTKKNLSIYEISFNDKETDIRINAGREKNNYRISIYDKENIYHYLLTFENNNLGIYSGRNLSLVFNNNGFLYLTLKDFSIPFLNNDILFNTSLTADINEGRIYKSKITASNFKSFNNQKSAVTGEFEINNGALTIDNVEFTNGSNYITGILTGNFISDEGSIKIEGTSLLKDENKNESYSLNFKIQDGVINSRFFVSNMYIDKILGNNSSGFINLRLSVNGKLTNPDISLEGETKSAFYNGKSIRAFFITKKQNNFFSINNLILESGGNLRLQLNNSSFELNDGSFTKIKLNGDLYAAVIEKRIKSSFSLTGNYTNRDDFKLRLSLPENSIAYGKGGRITDIDKLDNLLYSITSGGGRTALESVNSNNVRFFIDKNSIIGNIFTEGKRIVNVNLSKDFENNLRGTVELFNFPISIANLATKPYVNFIKGNISGKVTASGKISDPLLYGQIKLFEGEITIPDYVQKPITNLSGIINASGKKLNVINVSGNSGGGLVNGYGEIGITDDNKFDGYNFYVSSSTVPALFKIGVLDIAGKGNVNNFQFEGRPGLYGFYGDIFVDQADINISNFQSQAVNQTQKEQSRTPIFVKLNFTAGRRVEVNYPLISGIISQNNSLLLEYSLADNQLNMLGNINFRTGKINYLNKIFKIEEASVRFDEFSNGINPEMNIVSSFSTRDSNRNKVQLFLNITDRLFSFKTNFYSTPQLSEFEINQLLGLAFTPSENPENEAFSGIRSIESLQNTTNYLGSIFLFNPLENYIRRALNLDVFSFNSYIFGNVLASDTTLLDMLDKSSLAIGKYVTEGFYLESLMTFNKNNDIRGGNFIPIPETEYGLNLKLQVLLELPFISLGYSYRPMDINNFANAEQMISIETSFKF